MFLLSPSAFFWDFAILILLCLGIGGGVGCTVLRMRKKRRWILLPELILYICGLLVAYGSFIEPQIIVVTRGDVDLPGEHNFSIAIISDLHTGTYKGEDFVRRVVRTTNDLLPDLIVLPGDFILDQDSPLDALKPLAHLRSSMGVFAVTGNHDVGRINSLTGDRVAFSNRSNEIVEYLEGFGLDVLQNESLMLPNSTDTYLAGIDDIWIETSDLSRALSYVQSGTTILLSHNPDIVIDPLSRKADLVISGHTHGGQIRLPGLGPIAPLPTKLGKAFDHGIFEIDSNTTLALTRGAGESSPRSRLFAWPEVMLLEIR